MVLVTEMIHWTSFAELLQVQVLRMLEALTMLARLYRRMLESLIQICWLAEVHRVSPHLVRSSLPRRFGHRLDECSTVKVAPYVIYRVPVLPHVDFASTNLLDDCLSVIVLHDCIARLDLKGAIQ